jgi:hypothetical protein
MAMFTSPEIIVGLWFVPVVLCILVPLAMLSIWAVIQTFKKMVGENKPVGRAAKKEQGELFNKGLKHPLAA